MGVIQQGQESFRAYARLISILGDQLISDKWVGVIELVKNSYDADAEDVKVRFSNFDSAKENWAIEIEDDGVGMTLDTIKNVWMKPATPNKLNVKKLGDKELRLTDSGRAMQGDKGVGRFAIYKLGYQIELYTKTKSTNEVKLKLDFSEYADDEFRESNHIDKFLDQIKNRWFENDTPEQILNDKNQGTKIVIKNIRDEWKKKDLDKLQRAFYRMTPPELPREYDPKLSFETTVFWNGEKQKKNQKRFEDYLEKAPFYFEGIISDGGELEYVYKYNNKSKSGVINFFNDLELIAHHQIWRIKFFREVFLEEIEEKKKFDIENYQINHKPSFGPFYFYLYSFNLNDPSEGYTKEEKDFIKEHTVFLFRDDVRVFPFGERGVDWLLLSKGRAEDRAGDYFSYNDLLGFVFITQNDNPQLRDAADREGLMNIDGAYDDFVAMLQASLKVMKDFVDIDKAKKDLKKRKAERNLYEKFKKAFNRLQRKILEYDDVDLLKKSTILFDATNELVEKTREDLKITQELAGTGMAVEKATHDTMSLLKKLKVNAEDFLKKIESREFNKGDLVTFLSDIREDLEFLYQELQVLQPLFRVARKVTKDVSVEKVANRVIRYFRSELNSYKIHVELEVTQDIVVKTNTGLILQVLLNLMDNAIYWIKQYPEKGNSIKIFIDGINNRLIFADSGPGIDKEIVDIVFSEFYSKKEEGRGLGLYIVKELLHRINAEINVIINNESKILKGANLVIEFQGGD